MTKAGGITVADSEQVELQYRQADLARRKARRDIELTKVAAPFGGVVTARYARAGRFVNVGDTLFRVTETAPLMARVRVPEATAASVHVGDHATVSNDDGATAGAVVASAAPVIDAASGTREVVLRVSETSRLIPGRERHRSTRRAAATRRRHPARRGSARRIRARRRKAPDGASPGDARRRPRRRARRGRERSVTRRADRPARLVTAAHFPSTPGSGVSPAAPSRPHDRRAAVQGREELRREGSDDAEVFPLWRGRDRGDALLRRAPHARRDRARLGRTGDAHSGAHGRRVRTQALVDRRTGADARRAHDARVGAAARRATTAAPADAVSGRAAAHALVDGRPRRGVRPRSAGDSLVLHAGVSRGVGAAVRRVLRRSRVEVGRVLAHCRATYSLANLTFGAVVVLWFTALAVILIHELGHAFTCKYFGGEVHEMGFMLMYFQPAFYCNVNDAWSFPEVRLQALGHRRRRVDSVRGRRRGRAGRGRRQTRHARGRDRGRGDAHRRGDDDAHQHESAHPARRLLRADRLARDPESPPTRAGVRRVVGASPLRCGSTCRSRR